MMITVRRSQWVALLELAETWLAFSGNGEGGAAGAVTWVQVQEAGARAHQALYDPEEGVRRDETALEAEVARLRVHVRTLQKALGAAARAAEAASEAPGATAPPAAPVARAPAIEVTRALGYLQAADTAPADPVEAYRAGMRYAAQVIARQPVTTGSTPDPHTGGARKI